MTRYIDYEYINNIRKNYKSYSIKTILNASDGYELLEWQNTVYGNHTTKEIMDAYNDSKLQYAM